MTRITLTLERIVGGTALLLMLGLLTLTLGTPVPTAARPVIIIATPRITPSSAVLARAPAEQEPPAVQPTPPLTLPWPTDAPVPTPAPPPPPVAAVVEVSPPPAESKLVYESDGSVTLPGVDDWYEPPPASAPTAAPATAPLPPRGGCGPRCGWQPKK